VIAASPPRSPNEEWASTLREVTNRLSMTATKGREWLKSPSAHEKTLVIKRMQSPNQPKQQHELHHANSCRVNMKHKSAYFWEPFRLRWKSGVLHCVNRMSRKSVLEADGPIVSMTSHGTRLQFVHIGIESIAQGTQRPSRLILWIDEPSALQQLSPGLQRLQRRGLEIKLTENLGPHTKYQPALALPELQTHPLVTADDDIMYPTDWLAGLTKAYLEAPDMVHCYRAHVMTFADGGLRPYSQWKACTTDQPAHQNFLTGVSGVIYPPSMVSALKNAGRSFLTCCPKADDIWLNAIAVRSGHMVRQIKRFAQHFDTIPRTQGIALMSHNVVDGGNDAQARATYTQFDLAKLNSSATSARKR
jgi:hypothetical protein